MRQISCGFTKKGSVAVMVFATLGLQPRGKRVPNVLSEFAGITWVRAVDLPDLTKKLCIASAVNNVPSGSKFVFFTVGEWTLGTTELKHVMLSRELREKSPGLAKVVDYIQTKQREEGKDPEKDLMVAEDTWCALRGL